MKTTRHMAALPLATGALLVAIGCSHQPSASAPAVAGTQPPMGVTNAQNEADMRVVDKLTAARCDHEQTCNDVGPGQKYVSRQVCIDQVRGSMANDLNAYDCARGIDKNALDTCLASLRGGKCSSAIGQLFSASSCAASDLCIK